jgi:mono/diheme cytochrome c family protein
MPGWQDKLSVDERWDLAFYIWNFAIPLEMLNQGKTIFEQNCVACHGPDGKGVVPGAPDFTNVEWMASRAPSEFFQVVTEGRGTMPSWQGRLSPDERWAAIEYIRSFAYEPVSSAATTTSSQAPPAASPTEEPPPAAIPALYAEKGCVACHGDKAQGLIGPILAGVSVRHIKAVVRSGAPDEGMPPFDQKAISDDDLETLAQALNSLTLQDTGVQLSEAVLDHLNQAWDALQAGDKKAVETHLKKAQEVAVDAPQGVQVTLGHIVEHLGEDNWAEYTRMRLTTLLAK